MKYNKTKVSSGFIKKILIISIIGIISVFPIFIVYHINKIYSGIFRLLPNQVSDFLSNTKSECKRISNCKLLPGDILIRRYITERTWPIDKFAHIYFTHSAFYLGDNKIVEVVGKEKNNENEIRIVTLSKSDWLNSDINNFVIIRPDNYSSNLQTIKSNLKNIAEDPEFKFGLPKQGHKRATCADLIFQQLSDHKIINTFNNPKIITPDYLFWVAKNDPKNFKIIGHNI